MEYKSVVDKWAEEFKIADKIPNTGDLVVLLANLSLIGFIRKEVDNTFLDYVSNKYTPGISTEYFNITKEIVQKQILSFNYILSQEKSRTKTLDEIDDFDESKVDYDYLNFLEFDVSRLGNNK